MKDVLELLQIVVGKERAQLGHWLSAHALNEVPWRGRLLNREAARRRCRTKQVLITPPLRHGYRTVEFRTHEKLRYARCARTPSFWQAQVRPTVACACAAPSAMVRAERRAACMRSIRLIVAATAMPAAVHAVSPRQNVKMLLPALPRNSIELGSHFGYGDEKNCTGLPRRGPAALCTWLTMVPTAKSSSHIMVRSTWVASETSAMLPTQCSMLV